MLTNEHTQVHFHLHTYTTHAHTHTHRGTSGIHAHRKVLIGCCPALHDAIYWLRVQYPVARDSIAYNGRRGAATHAYTHTHIPSLSPRLSLSCTERLTHICVVYAAVLDASTNAFGPLPFDGIRHRYELEPRDATWQNKAHRRTARTRHSFCSVAPPAAVACE